MMDVSEDNRNQILQVAGRIIKRTGAIAKRGTIHRPGCNHALILLMHSLKTLWQRNLRVHGTLLENRTFAENIEPRANNCERSNSPFR